MQSQDVESRAGLHGRAARRLFDAPGGTKSLRPYSEMIAGYWRQVGALFTGGTKLARVSSVPLRRSHRHRRYRCWLATSASCAAPFFEDPIPTGEQVPLNEVRLLAPVLPSKIVCVGKNYAAHAAEFGGEVPEEPLLFLKPSTAVIGPGDPIELLPISKRIASGRASWPVMLASCARHAHCAEDTYRYVLGYTCANDVTLRDLQRMDDQWARAKGFDGSCPLGPWVETELDPNDIRLETRLNGEIVQAAQTSDMVFGVAELIEYITEFMTLLPGDVLVTGTPEGVGRLARGDVVEVEVQGVGTLSNPVVA